MYIYDTYMHASKHTSSGGSSHLSHSTVGMDFPAWALLCLLEHTVPDMGLLIVGSVNSVQIQRGTVYCRVFSENVRHLMYSLGRGVSLYFWLADFYVQKCLKAGADFSVFHRLKIIASVLYLRYLTEITHHYCITTKKQIATGNVAT